MINRIAIVTKKQKPEADELGRQLREWLGQRGVAAAVLVNEPEPSVPMLPPGTQCIVVLGGDGTLLSAARHYGQDGVPILGVNVGGLGFITAVGRGDLYPAMEKILVGDYQVEDRMLLTGAVVRGGVKTFQQTVMNDVVINKGALARIVELETFIDDEYLITYRADGLIVSTPTGSTAYTLGAGGPIVFPTLHTITLIPICPFALTNRAIILPDTATISVHLDDKVQDVYLTFDGQLGLALEAGDVVEIQKAAGTIKLIRSPYKSYFEILRTKLRWGEM